jgi:predicted outer membrane lipoprotein
VRVGSRHAHGACLFEAGVLMSLSSLGSLLVAGFGVLLAVWSLWLENRVR